MTETVKTRRRKVRKEPIAAELRLLDWGSRGSAHADLDGKPVLVARGIPGERVVGLVDMRHRPKRGVVEEILEASPDRILPPCPYYTRGCGGCQWQHMAYEAQVAAKRRGVDREMERADVGVRVDRVHAMRDPWRYRHTAAIALGWEAGFRPLQRRGIVQIDDCPISHPLIGSLAAAMNQNLGQGAIPNYHGKVWLDCTVVGTEEALALQVLIQGISGLTLETHPELPEVAERISGVEGVATVAFRHRSGEAIPLIGALMSTIAVQGHPMFLPAGSFFQTNLVMLSRLLDQMREELVGREVRHLADVYGGVGTFGLNLAGQADQVTLIELDSHAVTAAERTATLWGLENVTFIPRHAERALADLPPVDLAVVDPPRSGLGDVVTAAIAQNGVPVIFYVSCAPASLADDLAALQTAGYRVRSLEIFDFYPQTYHVESFAVLER